MTIKTQSNLYIFSAKHASTGASVFLFQVELDKQAALDKASIYAAENGFFEVEFYDKCNSNETWYTLVSH